MTIVIDHNRYQSRSKSPLLSTYVLSWSFSHDLFQLFFSTEPYDDKKYLVQYPYAL